MLEFIRRTGPDVLGQIFVNLTMLPVSIIFIDAILVAFFIWIMMYLYKKRHVEANRKKQIILAMLAVAILAVIMSLTAYTYINQNLIIR
jgi:membrane-associated HD superfamily phosphohydrolase